MTPAFGIVANTCFRFARGGLGAGALLGGLYGTVTAAVLAVDGGVFPPVWLLLIGFAYGAVCGAIAGLGAGIASGLLVGVLLRSSSRSRRAGAADRRVVPATSATGFALVTTLGLIALYAWSGELLRDGITEILLFSAVPGFLAALAGWWIGRRFIDWYELEWDGSAAPPAAKTVPPSGPP